MTILPSIEAQHNGAVAAPGLHQRWALRWITRSRMVRELRWQAYHRAKPRDFPAPVAVA
jgi:hypothetical protein